MQAIELGMREPPSNRWATEGSELGTPAGELLRQTAQLNQSGDLAAPSSTAIQLLVPTRRTSANPFYSLYPRFTCIGP
ncbi:hypothetical protein PAHAL_5G254700 [Panicum hallii]|uniref:Uncharacterized protein n=1 Tax=Panicum hallii TaxID=206008 RepID=A0A2T8IL70_9POAL|nr:hypothetical protein PAHAL_5G254700 [Panicum hallii]